MPSLKERYRGMLLGTAVGDAVGLSAEGIPRVRAKKMFKGVWRHRFIFGQGMISDDTEHTLFVVQSLLAYPQSPELFARRLGWCLRWWFASLPAGIGLATARACVKIWLGFKPGKSGVFSAGNGPAMRVAPIGAFFSESPVKRNTFTECCTTLTHTHPKALVGAKAIAFTAAWIVRDDLKQRPAVDAFADLLIGIASEDAEWADIVKSIKIHLDKDASVEEFSDALGLHQGVTGYIYHTVPVVLFAWHKHFGDYEKTLTSVLDCGGDTDTTGAIVGALAGLSVGEKGIPPDWIHGICDWPRSPSLLRNVADRLSELKENNVKIEPCQYFWPGVVLRNFAFLLIVLSHGFRRLLPPYGP
ncbi:MAG: ADP-ribosylglycohydrolase family protein [Planctomycetota bacterium]